MKKNIVNLIYLCVISISLTACSWLDVVPEDDIETIETTFEKREDAYTWFKTCYSMITMDISDVNQCPICRHSLAFRNSKTSDFFDTKYGGFAPKVRRFLSKKSGVFDFRYAPYSIVETASVSPLPKKVLQKKSCISYTIIPNLLYLLTVSGEGQGVGCK